MINLPPSVLHGSLMLPQQNSTSNTLRTVCQDPMGGTNHKSATLVGCIFRHFALKINSYLRAREMSPEETMAKCQCKVVMASSLGKRPAMSWKDVTWPGGWRSPLNSKQQKQGRCSGDFTSTRWVFWGLHQGRYATYR